jgi:intracellular septation protein
MITLALNIAIEFGPVAAFIASYWLWGFFVAIEATMLVTAVSVALAYVRHRRLALFPTFTAATVLSFGGLSLVTQNETFFIFLDTVSNLIFGLLLAVSLYFERPVLKPMFERVFALTDAGWHTLTWRWMLFLLSVGILNECVRLLGTPEVWVLFKTLNVVVTTTFAFWQFRLASRTRIPAESNRWGLRVVEKGTSH